MTRTKAEMLIDGLGGRPINDLIDGWVIMIDEISPYVFKAVAKDVNGHSVDSFGGNAENALNNCVKAINRIVYFQSFILRIRDTISKLIRFR